MRENRIRLFVPKINDNCGDVLPIYNIKHLILEINAFYVIEVNRRDEQKPITRIIVHLPSELFDLFPAPDQESMMRFPKTYPRNHKEPPKNKEKECNNEIEK
jgi:hypothetical protein